MRSHNARKRLWATSLLAIAILTSTACADSSSDTTLSGESSGASWSSDELRGVIEFCSSLWLNSSACTRVARELRNYGCEVDPAYELITTSAEVDAEPDEASRIEMWQSAVAELCPAGDPEDFPRGFIRTTTTSESPDQ